MTTAVPYAHTSTPESVYSSQNATGGLLVNSSRLDVPRDRQCYLTSVAYVPADSTKKVPSAGRMFAAVRRAESS